MKKIGKDRMACFDRASPALKEILLNLYNARKPVELDHHLHEFGSVEYHVESSASSPHDTYLSVSTPLLSQGIVPASRLSPQTLEMIKAICPDVLEIVEPAKEGYQVTLRLKFVRLPSNNASIKIISDISSVQSVILSSQLKQILWNANSLDVCEGAYTPIKLVYHPREPFYVIKQPTKITAVFPMRFKEDTDVIIATAFFQELMDVGSKEAFSKAPHCIWSPIPPLELRGELIEDLSTNGGFVSFDINSRHVEGKKLDKTVWNLLNFCAFVKYHVKSTRGFIQRRMRTRSETMVEVLHKEEVQEDQNTKRKTRAWRRMRKLVILSKERIQKQRSKLKIKINRLRSRLRIHGFSRFRRKWLKILKFSSVTSYTRLEKC
ncbi:hypothetical protein LIER_14628 [Lithospermum erythrorhizon]|uniref:Arp2/3 complex 34 kDa subunit n=1 Tax=Lithospermum erythrorhizon TaxID=34254 RepID=A0AAV3Q3Z3_LITER